MVRFVSFYPVLVAWVGDVGRTKNISIVNGKYSTSSCNAYLKLRQAVWLFNKIQTCTVNILNLSQVLLKCWQSQILAVTLDKFVIFSRSLGKWIPPPCPEHTKL